jgi:hypothetical protein
MDFSLRCTSCGSLLQQRAKALDLFSTIYNLWRYPDFTFRKIILAEHRNYTTAIAIVEGIGLSFLSLYLLKAGDIFSIDLTRLITTGIQLGVIVYFPLLVLFSTSGYFAARVSKTGASFRGFLSSMTYALHPVGVGALMIFPTEIAVFGPYLFSSNPSPMTINPVPLYLLGFLDCLLGIAGIAFIFKLTRLLFGRREKAAIFLGIFFILFFVAVRITSAVLHLSASVP